MNIITLDFETYFDTEYSLKRMNTEAYIRDSRFRVHGAAIKWNDRPTVWHAGDVLPSILSKEEFDWTDTAVLCHHAHFDGLILTHHFGIKPKLWLDTLSMARAVLGNHLPAGLDALAKHFGLGAKTVPYEHFKGRHWSQITSDVQAQIAEGCRHDVDLTWAIFNKLATAFPPQELLLIDRTIRMFTEGVLQGDMELLADIWAAEAAHKASMHESLGVTPEQLQSANRFTELLEAEGIEIAYKKGKNDNDIPAFARTDKFMEDLLEDESDRVRALAEARLGTKSTMVQTRAAALGYMSQRGALCVYLRYCGAHTTRWAGGDGTNFQNLRRGHDLRRAIRAAPGYVLAIVDLAQIECRLLNWLAGQDDVVQRFRNGEDPYVALASEIHGRPITKEDKAERGIGKQGELSCGYGCGWQKFQKVAALGTYGPKVELTETEARRAVDTYRRTHTRVSGYWVQAEWMLQRLADPRYPATAWGPMLVANQKIKLPNGLFLDYSTLERSADGWTVKTRAGRVKQYGAKLVENVVQALARVIFGEALLRLPDLKLAMMSHDEAVFVLRDDADDINFILDEFRKSPAWAPDLPLDAEGHLDTVYSK